MKFNYSSLLFFLLIAITLNNFIYTQVINDINLLNELIASNELVDGDLDPTFGELGCVITDINNKDNAINSLAINTLNNIVVAGYYTPTTGTARQFVTARYINYPTYVGDTIIPSGSLDPSYYPDGGIDPGEPKLPGVAAFNFDEFDQSEALDLVIFNDQEITAGGYSENNNIKTLTEVLYTSGDINFALAVTFPIGVESVANAQVLDPLENLIVAGYAKESLTGPRLFMVAKLLDIDNADVNFGNRNGAAITPINEDSEVYAITLDPSNRIIAVGRSRINNQEVIAVVRYTADGLLDRSFNSTSDTPGIITTALGTNAEARAVTLDFFGNIIVAGFAEIDGANRAVVIRYTPNGDLDTTFNEIETRPAIVIADIRLNGTATLEDQATGVIVDRRGNVVISGFSKISNTITNAFTARYTQEGLPDLSYNFFGNYTTIDFTQTLISEDDNTRLISEIQDVDRQQSQVPQGVALYNFNNIGSSTPDTHAIINAIKLDSNQQYILGGSLESDGQIDFLLLRCFNEASLNVPSRAVVVEPPAPKEIIFTTIIPETIPFQEVITITGEAPGYSTVVFLLNGIRLDNVVATAEGTWAYTLANLEPGNYTFQAFVETLTGAPIVSSVVNFSVTNLQLNAPSLTTSINTPVIPGSPIPLQGNALPNSTVQIYINNQPLTQTTTNEQGQWAIAIEENFRPGIYEFKAQVIDPNNEDSMLSKPITIEVNTPEPNANNQPTNTIEPKNSLSEGIQPLAITAPFHKSTINTTQPVISGVSDPNTLISINIDNTAVGTTKSNAQGQWSYKLTPNVFTKDGTYLITAQSKQIKTPSVRVTLDTQAPNPPLITASQGHTIQGMAEPNSTITIFTGDTLLSKVSVDSNGSWTYIIADQNIPESQKLPLSVAVTDNAGNISTIITQEIDITQEG